MPVIVRSSTETVGGFALKPYDPALDLLTRKVLESLQATGEAAASPVPLPQRRYSILMRIQRPMRSVRRSLDGLNILLPPIAGEGILAGDHILRNFEHATQPGVFRNSESLST
jgi:hypothetical protein